MKETKPYQYHNTACSRAPYFICCHFPNLVNGGALYLLIQFKHEDQNTTMKPHLKVCKGAFIEN